mgnify:CR=1 FL=1
MKLFSYSSRPVHLGPYPLERLARQREMRDLAAVPVMGPVSPAGEVDPKSLMEALTHPIGMLVVGREVEVTPLQQTIAGELQEVTCRR